MDLLENVKSTLQTNFYAIHPENMLLAMVFDPSKQKQAVEIIQSRRKKDYKRIRKFHWPKTAKINFEAEQYCDLINFGDFKLKEFSSPPLLDGYDIEDIESFSLDDFSLLFFFNFSDLIDIFLNVLFKEGGLIGPFKDRGI